MLDENLVAQLTRSGIVTDTFRRLPPEKKERLYRTAIRLFGEYGYDGAAIDRLCTEAGVSKGSFFQYFPSKMHLLEFAILVFDGFLAEWTAEVRASEPSALARDRLAYLYQALVMNSKLSRSEEKFYHFVTSAVHHSVVSVSGIDLERHVHEYVAGIIRRGEETGEIRRDFGVDLIGHLVSLIVGGPVSRQHVGRRLPRQQTAEHLISFLFDGIKA